MPSGHGPHSVDPGRAEETSAASHGAKPAEPARGALRGLWLALAALSFGAAAAGAVLPGLPTTPFLLVTSWCLARSSPKLNERLKRSRLFGPLLRDWSEHRGVRSHVKIAAVSTIVLVVSASLVFGDLGAKLGSLVAGLAVVGVVVVLRLKTLRD